MQCVAEGGTYLAGAVGTLQLMKVRAASWRRGDLGTRRWPTTP